MACPFLHRQSSGLQQLFNSQLDFEMDGVAGVPPPADGPPPGAEGVEDVVRGGNNVNCEAALVLGLSWGKGRVFALPGEVIRVEDLLLSAGPSSGSDS